MPDFPWRVWEVSSQEVIREFRSGKGTGVNQLNVRKSIPGKGNSMCGTSELEESMVTEEQKEGQCGWDAAMK